MAVASLVLGLTGIILFIFFAIPSILAVIFGSVGNRQIRESGGAETGTGMAVTGIVLGSIEIVVFLIAAATGGFYFHIG